VGFGAALKKCTGCKVERNQTKGEKTTYCARGEKNAAIEDELIGRKAGPMRGEPILGGGRKRCGWGRTKRRPEYEASRDDIFYSRKRKWGKKSRNHRRSKFSGCGVWRGRKTRRSAQAALYGGKKKNRPE